MVKRVLLVFTALVALLIVAQVNVFGQTATSSPSASPSPSGSMSPSPSVTVPSGAPATGHGM